MACDLPWELWERWPVNELPGEWEGVTMENGRVVQLDMEDFDLTGALPAEVGRLSALRVLSVAGNELTSVPAEIGQLTSLEKLHLSRKSADERAGGDRAAHIAGTCTSAAIS